MTREFQEFFWHKRNFNDRDDKGVSREFFRINPVLREIREFFGTNATLTPGMTREYRQSFFSYKCNFNARDDKGVSRVFFGTNAALTTGMTIGSFDSFFFV